MSDSRIGKKCLACDKEATDRCKSYCKKHCNEYCRGIVANE